MFAQFDTMDGITKTLSTVQGLCLIKNVDFSYVAINNVCRQYIGATDSFKPEGLSDYDFSWDFYAHHVRSHDEKVLNQGLWSGIEIGSDFKKKRITPFFSNKFLVNSNVQKKSFILVISTPIASNLAKGFISQQEQVIAEFSSECKDISMEFNVYDKNLSTRQQECLYFLIRGKTAKEIAQYLYLSKRTVESHIEKLKNFFNVSRRSDLLALAFANAWHEIIPLSLCKKKNIFLKIIQEEK